MTDISNTINSSSSVTVGAGQAIAVESHETVLSPEIRKAMDIIFPKSAVQLLQGGCSLADDTCLNTEGCHDNVHSETTSAESVVNDAVLTSCAPSGNITTLITTNTVMGTSNDVLTNANENESPAGLLLPSSTDSVAGAVANSNNQDITNTVMGTSNAVLTNANGSESPAGLLLPSSTDSVAGAVANSNNQDITNTVMGTSNDVLINANENESPAGLLLPSSTDFVTGAFANSNNQDITNTVMGTSNDVLTNANENESPAGLLLPSSTDSVAGAVANSNNQDITNTVMGTSNDVLTNANKNESPAGLLLPSSTDFVTGAFANSKNQDITNTVMGTSNDVLTNANGNESPAGLLLPSSTDFVTGAVTTSNNQNITNADIEPVNTSLESAKKTVVKMVIAQADLEIVSSCEVFNNESLEKTSRRLHSADLSSSECHSRGDSDSEDMRRPFASIAREKKKQKKKKKKDNDSVKSSNSNEINENISLELKSASESCIQNDTSAVYPSTSNSPLSLTDFNCDPKLPEKNAEIETFQYDNVINKCTSELNNKHSDSQSLILENGYVDNEHFGKNSEMITEEISNISFSSTKENENQRSRSKQKLPKIKTHRFNIVKHKKKIMNTFPPCFIVVKKLRMHNFMKDCGRAERILPLSTRLKLLSDLCDQGLVKCKQTRGEDGEELIYRNIFEETVLPEMADDFVNSSRGRNLRKRDKKISYVEPTEDDILDEYSRKRHRSKHKDAAVRSEDENTSENKKKKKHASLSESKTDASNTVTSLTVAPPQDSSDRRKAVVDTGTNSESSKTKSKSHKTKINGKGKDKTKEIIVYPPVCVGSRNFYYVKDGAAAKTSVENSTLQANQTPISTIQVSPPSTNITILPTTTISGAFMHHPNPVSLFTSLPLSIPVSLPTQNLISGAPFPTQMSTAGGLKKPPHYCVVKMDGKDVLLQIVSSGGIGTAVPVVVPKGKTLFAPSVPLVTGSPHLYPFHQRASTPSSTQAMPVPLTSVVTVSQGNAAPTAPLQPLMGIQVISRPITTSSQNVSVSALPVIQTAQLTSLTSTASVRPIHLPTPRQQISQSSAAGMLTPITVLSTSNSGASVTSVASTRSISALPSAVTPMPAPNTTTVVRTVRVPGPNLRAIVPNQATSLRSFRIFVPGCSATGMPSRFATLGTIANSSPLTHLAASSMLLPQRKRNSDLEMTPEMRAAKRRKLEKKYPLPPGVVIKTEPLDALPKPSPMITTVGGSRSLLSQNLHLLSASRPGTNFQSIRIIGPSLANSLSARNIRGNSNIIYRAASIGGGQTILLPTSLGQISTRTTTTVTSVSVNSLPSLTTSSLNHTVTSAGDTGNNTATNAANASDSSVASSVSFSSFRAISEINPLSPVPQSTESTATATLASISSNAAESLELDTSSTSSVVISSEPVLTTNTVNTSSVSLLSSGMESLQNSVTSTVADNLRSVTSSPSLASAKGPCETSAVEILKNGLEELKKFIQVQEMCGLKGDRLVKLKELLRRKEEQYKDVLQLADGGVSLLPASQTNGDIGGGEESDVPLNGPGGSETDPFVID